MAFVLDAVGDRPDDAPNNQLFSLNNDSSTIAKPSSVEVRRKLRDAIFSFSDSTEGLAEYKKRLFELNGNTSPAQSHANVPKKHKLVKPLIPETSFEMKKDENAHSYRIKKQLQSEVQKALSKAVVTPDFEQLASVPPYEVSKRKLLRERKKEKDKTKGTGWFGMPATEMTDEVKNDLEIVQMRSVLDPKHFYKKNDLKVLPKYFQRQ
ncbi:hypothetical protein YQE_02248, partial [Dendroctonus ponderosae]